MAGETLNQLIKNQAFECKVDYKPWEEDLPPQDYFEYGYVRGAEWFRKSEKLHPVRMWTVKVFDDHETEDSPRTYTVPATSSRDAQLMAFILDRGLEDAKYGDGGIVERGEMELALVHSEVVTSTGA